MSSCVTDTKNWFINQGLTRPGVVTGWALLIITTVALIVLAATNPWKLPPLGTGLLCGGATSTLILACVWRHFNNRHRVDTLIWGYLKTLNNFNRDIKAIVDGINILNYPLQIDSLKCMIVMRSNTVGELQYLYSDIFKQGSLRDSVKAFLERKELPPPNQRLDVFLFLRKTNGSFELDHYSITMDMYNTEGKLPPVCYSVSSCTTREADPGPDGTFSKYLDSIGIPAQNRLVFNGHFC